MKKRVLSALCALCFAVSLAGTAFAETYSVTLTQEEAGGEVPTALEIPAQTPADVGGALDYIRITAPVSSAAVEIPINGDAAKTDVLLVNSDGTYTVLDLTVKNESSIFVILPSASATLTVLKKMPFTDVLHANWYYNSTAFVYHYGLMNGTASNKFSPSTTVVRSMIATILWRQAGQPAPEGTVSFSDVPAGQFYTDAALWVAEQGIMTGSGGKFLPNGTITREDLALTMYRYCSRMGYDVSGRADLTVFTDSNAISAGAWSAMSWAVDAGLFAGTGNQKISPTTTVTRCELATILMRFLGSGYLEEDTEETEEDVSDTEVAENAGDSNL